MASYEVTMRDRSVERVGEADAYQQEGQMTTFFRTADGRAVDSWSTRMASFRTSEILIIRRDDAEAADLSPGLSLASSA
jgi:hypothetical protein